MSVAHSEESSSTTPTSAGFTSKLDPLGEGSSSRRATDSVSSPASDTPSRRAPTPPLLRPPAGQTFVGHVKSWGASEIANFLSLYKCDQYILMFNQNDIDGKVLLDLDMASLKEIGIGKIGDRVKLLSGVRELRKRAARPPTITLSGRTYTSATGPEGSPIPALEHDTKGSQVPKRLATAIVSKRLQLSRPPPLDLRRSPMRQAEASLPVGSPSSRTATPRLSHSHPGLKVLGSEASGAKPASAVDVTGLRPPPGRDIRRSPSPSADEAMRAGVARPESAKPRSATAASKYADSPHRIENASGKVGSPTQNQAVPRESGLHPFASATRTETKDLHGGSRRPSGRPPHLSGHGQMTDTTLRPGQPSLEDLRRHLVKFVNSEDGTTRTVNVSSCTSGVEVLERVLKKFGKSSTGSFVMDSEGDSDKLEVDGWGVFIRSDSADDDLALSESALLDICQGHRSPRIGMHHDPAVLRERGLLLRRVSHPVNRKNMEIFFGDAPPPVSPNSPLHYGVPRLTGLQSDESWAQEPSTKTTITSKKTNRASTVSIMSGLGVPGVVEPAPPASSARSSTNGMAAASRSKRMYNFFGHRPPSELISNHLADYFPSARKRDLEKTVRQSMMRLSQGQGLAVGQVQAPIDPADAPSPNRKARPPSTRTVSSSTTPAAIPEEVETPARDADAALQAASVAPHPPLLPPFEPAGESLVDSLQQYSPAPSTVRPPFRQGRRGSSGSTLSRISVISSIRKSKDKSDTASLLTVDEITAEVENRRASMSMFNDSLEQERPSSPITSDFVGEDETSGSDNSDEGSPESSLATSDDEDHEQGRAFTSTGSRQIIKWIKGALIGAGSFGSVFLGMDAHSGLLMAVKQVELPSGDARNEERKRNMVQALEREIELLKELQHENIVQYLDSATDGNNLYIFLEYVPGGSVAALLSSYGAFEEALVRNFSRQILTGLNYLHERNIIHRDIKGANILVDNKGGIKISDFGISKKAESNLMERANRPSLQGSVFWMAPEVVKQTSYTSKADIWSVGCLVVEMLTGTHPWADLTQMQAIFRIGSLACPATPSDISSEATDFLRRTFEINHNARPTASALLEHPFIAAQPASSRAPMSLEQANATLEAVAASRNNAMPGMPGLGLGIAAKEGAR